MDDTERIIRGYRGEPIEIQKVLEKIKELADRNGWRRDPASPVHESGTPATGLLAYHRLSKSSLHRVYLSTGIHGDEPAGPVAILQMLKENIWPHGVDIFLCPCLNLTGFPLNRRENANGIDLNRDYREPQSDEIRAHIEWLKRKPGFDVALCLHEDWEAQGFYLYELNPDDQPSFAKKIISRVAEICPIDRSSTIDNWPAENGIIHPNKDPFQRPKWPEALYLITNKTRLSYTLESPSSFPLATRVEALIKGVRAVLDSISGHPIFRAD